MPFIASFSVDTSKTHPFPFNIPAVVFAKNVGIDQRVTIFVGDNGSGKSTLLEALALTVDLPLIGGHIGDKPGFEAARLLKPYINIGWRRNTRQGFFFRAEDFSDFINSVENSRRSISDHLSDLKGEVDDSIINRLNDSMNFSLYKMREQYGENMQAFSHGEAYLKILETRIGNKGIYLLDEPEAALSPLKQLSLMSLMLEILRKGNAQFIIATHSPILMGFPDATLYEIQDSGMEKVAFKETDHYRITKTFLDNPDHYLRHL